MAEILIVGARGLGEEVRGYLRDDERYGPIAFLDELDVDEVLGLPVITPTPTTAIAAAPSSPRSAATPTSATSSSSTSTPRWATTPVSATAAP